MQYGKICDPKGDASLVRLLGADERAAHVQVVDENARQPQDGAGSHGAACPGTCAARVGSDGVVGGICRERETAHRESGRQAPEQPVPVRISSLEEVVCPGSRRALERDIHRRARPPTINAIPIAMRRRSPPGTACSTNAAAASAAIHHRFMTPTASAVAMSAQQQPTQ